ncbi:MAG: NADH-quinone oxidoreductase subunit M [Rhodobacterales bacterium]|nr:MAG: NADH-quinone oxidoreductase subunit M [Rhodobacterales bacterium]
MDNLLSIITFIPALAALILALFLRGNAPAAQTNAKWLAILATAATFLLSLFIISGFDPAQSDFQFAEQHKWVMGLTYKMGVDGASVLFVMLTTFLMPIIIAASWNITERVKDYMIALLLLQSLILGAFMALDLVLFYAFFEASLIPVFLLIGIWGGAERIAAAFRFFLFSLLGSVLMLVAIIVIYRNTGTTDVTTLLNHEFAAESRLLLGVPITGGLQTLLWLAFFIALAVKMPIWPLHIWAPQAQAQAPTAGAVVLAALLLNIGGYGFLRFLIPMFPVATQSMAPLMLWVSAIAVIYALLVALVQEDMKKLLAFISIAHMGYVTMGLFALNPQGVEGAMFQMISHGFILTALFLCVGVIHDRMHSSQIDAYGGLAVRMPRYAFVFMFFGMAVIGVPGTSGFVGLFLTLVGAFQVSSAAAVIAAFGMVLAAAAVLGMHRRVMFGDLIRESLKTIADMSARETAVFVPLAVMILLLGVYPAWVLDLIGPSVVALLDNYHAAVAVPDPLPVTVVE